MRYDKVEVGLIGLEESTSGVDLDTFEQFPNEGFGLTGTEEDNVTVDSGPAEALPVARGIVVSNDSVGIHFEAGFDTGNGGMLLYVPMRLNRKRNGGNDVADVAPVQHLNKDATCQIQKALGIEIT
jgi:hypothetical protein